MYSSLKQRIMFSNNWSNSSTWDRAVELLKDHCAWRGAGSLRVEPRRGEATIHLSSNIGWISEFQPSRRNYKPPGRKRRDQLRKEGYRSRKVPFSVVCGASAPPGAGLPQQQDSQMTADPTSPLTPALQGDTKDTGEEKEKTSTQGKGTKGSRTRRRNFWRAGTRRRTNWRTDI